MWVLYFTFFVRQLLTLALSVAVNDDEGSFVGGFVFVIGSLV